MMNQLKTLLLMSWLTIMLIGIGAVLGGESGMTIALLLALGMNFNTYWFSDKIVFENVWCPSNYRIGSPGLL